MSDPAMAVLQRIVDGPWQHAGAARRACIDERWREFQAMQMPQPSRHRLLLRAQYDECLRRAVAMWSQPADVEIDIVPVWIGTSFEEDDNETWYRAHATRISGERYGIQEIRPVLRDADPAVDYHTHCRGRIWRVGNIVESESYAESVELELRRSRYGVLAGQVVELLSHEHRVSEQLARPTDTVPSYCTLVQPRVPDLDADILEELQGLAVRPE